jgi:hypothetical protein
LADNFEFVRWNSTEIELVSEIGGGEVVESTGDEPIAAVLDRQVVDGMEWIRVQVGRGYAQDFVVHGWAPYAVDVSEGGHTVRVEPAYEPYEPECPQTPTVSDLDAMLPLQALHCFGSEPLTFSAVQVRNEGSEYGELVDGTPTWLVEGGELAMYWFPERAEMGSIRIYVDPASSVGAAPFGFAEHTWLEVTGRLDHPASAGCRVTSTYPEFDVANDEEAVAICRGRFVVTSARRLTEAEIPPAPAVPTPGAAPAGTVPVGLRIMDAPINDRIGASAVWTGTEMIVWGGWLWTEEDGLADARAGGAAYNPATGSWREIARGPLAPRANHLAVWTGSEMLMWGGYRDVYESDREMAAYDPVTDRWRLLAESPIDWTGRTHSVWIGNEWIIVSYSREDSPRTVGYSPATDSWRNLPAPPTEASEFSMVWTGSEVLIVADRLYRLDPAGDEWSSQAVNFHWPAVWAGDVLIGSQYTELSTQPFDSNAVSHPVSWDPRTNELTDLPLPPESVYGPVWTGRHLLYLENRLAFDLQTGDWLRLEFDEPEDVAIDRRVDAATVWADDRLITWGGWWACPGYSSRYDKGFELVPEWPASDGLAVQPGWVLQASVGRVSSLGRTIAASGTTVAAC